MTLEEDYHRLIKDYASLSQELQKTKRWLHACDRKRKILQVLCTHYDEGLCAALNYDQRCKTQCTIIGATWDGNKLIVPER